VLILIRNDTTTTRQNSKHLSFLLDKGQVKALFVSQLTTDFKIQKKINQKLLLITLGGGKHHEDDAVVVCLVARERGSSNNNSARCSVEEEEEGWCAFLFFFNFCVFDRFLDYTSALVRCSIFRKRELTRLAAAQRTTFRANVISFSLC